MPKIEFSWSHPNPEGLTYRLYENGKLAVDDIGEMHFSLTMTDKPHGKYVYTASCVNQFQLESIRSNEVVVDFFPPSAPTEFKAHISG